MRLSPVLLALVLSVVSCASPLAPAAGGPSQGEAQQGAGPKRIVAVTALEPVDFDKRVEAKDLVHSVLVTLNYQGQALPVLGEAVPSVENGLWRVLPDGRMETVWRLKPNAEWHDGTPVTAEDLVFAAQFGADRELARSREVHFDFLDTVEAIDQRTVVAKWKRPFIDADGLYMIQSPLPKHLLFSSYTENKEGFLRLPYWSTEFVGAGPFKLRELEPGSHMVVVANDRYVLGRPKIDEIEVKFMPDTNVQVVSVLSGHADVTMGRGLSIDQVVQARDQWREGRAEIPIGTPIVIYPQFVDASPAAMGTDVRFRRAFLHALDRQEIMETIQHGLVPVLYTYFSPAEPLYPEIESSIVKYPYDPRRATELLVEMGYTKAPDGAFYDRGGQKLAVEIRTTVADLHIKSMYAVSGHWSRLGIGVDPLAIPEQRSSDKEWRAQHPGFALSRAGGAVTASNSLKKFHSDQVPRPETRWNGSNDPRYVNPQWDAMLDRYYTAIPRDERIRALGDAVRHMTDQVVVLPLFGDSEPGLINNRVLNVSSRVTQEAKLTWNVHEWDVR